MVLISLTSPVLSSVAALLTIFMVAVTDMLLPGGKMLSLAALIGGVFIIIAFLLLSWSTYRELSEERRKKYVHHPQNKPSLTDETLDWPKMVFLLTTIAMNRRISE